MKQAEFVDKHDKTTDSPRGRRGDANNPNKITTIKFDGKHDIQREDKASNLRNAEYLPDDTQQKKLADLQAKFDYGLDQSGGINARAEPVSENEMKRCLDDAQRNFQ